MQADRASLPQDWREGRRLRAWELHRLGWKQNRIAEALGVSTSAVSQWLTRGSRDGVEGLRRRVAAGPAPRLTASQRERLPALLANGAEAYGFYDNVWTMCRVAAVIETEFGIHYHPAHISRLLRALDCRVQNQKGKRLQRSDATDH